MVNWPTKEVRDKVTILISCISLFAKTNTQRTLDSYHILPSGYIVSRHYFEHFQPRQTKVNQFATLITHFWDIGLSGICNSDWSRASWAVTQKHEFCHAYNLGWQVKYHNSCSRLFSGKSWHKIRIIKNKKCPIFKSSCQQKQNKPQKTAAARVPEEIKGICAI